MARSDRKPQSDPNALTPGGDPGYPRKLRLTWVADERVAVSNLPPRRSLAWLAEQGVTHVVNCRAMVQTLVTRDLVAERAVFGRSRVAHAPMWDLGRRQSPLLWRSAVRFAVRALDDPDARVLVHCQQGRRRSILVTYAVLRVRGHSAEAAGRLIADSRAEAQLVPAYLASVERWLAATAAPAP